MLQSHWTVPTDSVLWHLGLWSLVKGCRIYGPTPCRLDVVPSTSPMQWDNGTWRSSKSSMPRRLLGEVSQDASSVILVDSGTWFGDVRLGESACENTKNFQSRSWGIVSLNVCFPNSCRNAFGVSWCIWFAYLHNIMCPFCMYWFVGPVFPWVCHIIVFTCIFELLLFKPWNHPICPETWCNQGKKAQISRSSQAGHGKVQLQKTLSPTAGFREGRPKPKCGDDEELSKRLWMIGS